MQRIVAFLKAQSILSGGKRELEPFWSYGPASVRDVPLRDRLKEYLAEKAPKTYYFSEAGHAILRDRPNHHTNPFGLLRSVTERLAMLPAIAPFVEGMTRHDGSVDPLSLDVAVAATCLCDVFVGDARDRATPVWHEIEAAGEWLIHAEKDASVTERVIARRVADAVLWHHDGKDLAYPPAHIRPEMRLTALVNAFCTRKAIDAIYRPRVTVLAAETG